MTPPDPRTLYFFYRWRDAEMKLRGQKTGPSYSAADPSFLRNQPELSERERYHDELERCRAGAGAMGIFGVVFGVIFFLVLPTLSDGLSSAPMVLLPLVLSVVCLIATGGLWQRGQYAKSQLGRMDSEERAARWRVAREQRGDEQAERETEERERTRLRDDERRVAALRAKYELGDLHPVAAPISLEPNESCLFVCTCAGIDAKLQDQQIGNAQLVITTQRLVVIEPDSAHVSKLTDILRFSAVDDRTVRLWLTYRATAYDLIVDYPLETVAYLLIAFKSAGITPPRPAPPATP